MASMPHNAGDDADYVVACSNFEVSNSLQPNPYFECIPEFCSLSGTGPLSPYTGDAVYLPGSHVGETNLSFFNWFLVLQ